MDMSKSTCPKLQSGIFYACSNWVFFIRFASQKVPCFLVVEVTLVENGPFSTGVCDYVLVASDKIQLKSF
jgi:hypothetical protein